MSIIFFGNTKYSKIVEEKLHHEFGLSLVITLPDRPTGRKKILTPNPVKLFALENKIPVIEAEKPDKEVIAKIQNVILNPDLVGVKDLDSSGRGFDPQNDKRGKPDFLVVADYGLIIPDELLNLPKYAPLNIHHSLLPKYRGPSPAPTAILNGDKITGVTIIKMNNNVDAGDILNQKKYEMKGNETTDSLLIKLNKLGAEIIIPVIKNYKEYLKKAIKQDESKAIYTTKISKNDAFIDFENPPAKEIVDRMIRAYYPWPTVWTKVMMNNKLLMIKFLPEGKIQAEGGKPMSVKDFLNGYPEAKETIEKLLITNF